MTRLDLRSPDRIRAARLDAACMYLGTALFAAAAAWPAASILADMLATGAEARATAERWGTEAAAVMGERR